MKKLNIFITVVLFLVFFSGCTTTSKKQEDKNKESEPTVTRQKLNYPVDFGTTRDTKKLQLLRVKKN